MTNIIETNELSRNSRGGTELMLERISSRIDPELWNQFQIIPSRVRELDEDRKKILWLHDLPEDPESARLGEPWYRDKFDAIVCVSDWQMQRYNMVKNLPYSKAHVMLNGIEPIQIDWDTDKKDHSDNEQETVRLIYHTTPHRGLEILIPVFIELAKTHPEIHLDVYSSFNAYGWPERDLQYSGLFAKIVDHPQMTYHGFQPNDVIREALKTSHIFAYPNIWLETSCLALMEALSAGLLCIHPNHGALPETAMGLTKQYQFHEDLNDHAQIFYQCLKAVLENPSKEWLSKDYLLGYQKPIADRRYNVDRRAMEWSYLLTSLAAK